MSNNAERFAGGGESQSKREYPIERVIGRGFDDEDYETARAFLRDRFGRQDFIRDLERDKTEEEEKIVAWVNDETNALLALYGVRPLDIPSRNVHIIPEEQWPKREDFADSAAFYDFGTQSIFYRDNVWRSLFAYRLFHEQLHIKSHQAVQYVEEGGKKKLEAYRSGLTLTSAKREDFAAQFRRLNEAVIETLAVSFWQERVAPDEKFRGEMEKVGRLRAVLREEGEALKAANGLSDEELEQTVEEVCAAFAGKEEKPELVRFAYSAERAALGALISMLYERNAGAFADAGAVFDLFVKSAMTGHMVELGKLIDRTFGAGTFKRLGAISSEKHTKGELLAFVEDLRSQEKNGV
ncbi:MAG: hypothetical protein HYT14_00570 [Candidatus Liptonbacteria bacterium]|nr:hypothetical protein [Candidatus Liptonbacteria bacterium]